MNSTRTSIQPDSATTRRAVPFAKMQGLGNDFVVIQESDLVAAFPGASGGDGLDSLAEQLAVVLCRRNFGIGADGLILVGPARRPDCQVRWLFLNSDGSRSAMCGNGLRCLALYVVKNQLVSAGSFAVETAVGPVAIRFESADSITTDLGEPVLEPLRIPVAGLSSGKDRVLREKLTVGSVPYEVNCVSMGNPHCVIFIPEISPETLLEPALEIQKQQAFPEGVNVEFVSVTSSSEAHVYVVERGCGPTLACASGAAAVLVAGVLTGRLERKASIVLPGGRLTVEWSESDQHVRITGPARFSFLGEFDPAQYFQEAVTGT